MQTAESARARWCSLGTIPDSKSGIPKKWQKDHRGGRADVQLLAGADWHLADQRSYRILSKATGLTEEEDDCVNRRRIHAWRKREHRKIVFTCRFCCARPSRRFSRRRARSFWTRTVGGGGHALALLEAGASVIACDQDPEALEEASRRLAGFSGQVRFVESNFADVA